MVKVLFLIHDLGEGGAEKVLVNLVNHLNRSLFDVSVITLFGGGVNEQFLSPDVHYHSVWPGMIPGNSKWMKLFSPERLHSYCVKDHYDIEIAYLEGPSARIISGCPDLGTKLVGWVHIEQHSRAAASASFRNYKEARGCYERFDRIICVSDTVKQDFTMLFPSICHTEVLYNTIETETILALRDEPVNDVSFRSDEIKLAAVGKILKSKGFDRLARIVRRLREDGVPVHLYALGIGPERAGIENYLKDHHLEEYYTFLGYQVNPYKYVAKCDLFVCASLAEGFSTAATEALIVGTPVCTVRVSGMEEMLGSHNEWGVITENTEDALYEGIVQMIRQPGVLEHYKEKATERGRMFSTENTVAETEKMLLEL